jgi:transcriptional regulator with XRE-family HTH domain
MIREAITAAMKSEGLTAYAVAKLAGLDPGVVKRFVEGRTDMTASNLDKVFEVLGLSVGYADD